MLAPALKGVRGAGAPTKGTAVSRTGVGVGRRGARGDGGGGMNALTCFGTRATSVLLSTAGFGSGLGSGRGGSLAGAGKVGRAVLSCAMTLRWLRSSFNWNVGDGSRTTCRLDCGLG